MQSKDVGDTSTPVDALKNPTRSRSLTGQVIHGLRRFLRDDGVASGGGHGGVTVLDNPKPSGEYLPHTDLFDVSPQTALSLLSQYLKDARSDQETTARAVNVFEVLEGLFTITQLQHQPGVASPKLDQATHQLSTRLAQICSVTRQDDITIDSGSLAEALWDLDKHPELASASEPLLMATATCVLQAIPQQNQERIYRLIEENYPLAVALQVFNATSSSTSDPEQRMARLTRSYSSLDKIIAHKRPSSAEKAYQAALSPEGKVVTKPLTLTDSEAALLKEFFYMPVEEPFFPVAMDILKSFTTQNPDLTPAVANLAARIAGNAAQFNPELKELALSRFSFEALADYCVDLEGINYEDFKNYYLKANYDKDSNAIAGALKWKYQLLTAEEKQPDSPAAAAFQKLCRLLDRKYKQDTIKDLQEQAAGYNEQFHPRSLLVNYYQDIIGFVRDITPDGWRSADDPRYLTLFEGIKTALSGCSGPELAEICRSFADSGDSPPYLHQKNFMNFMNYIFYPLLSKAPALKTILWPLLKATVLPRSYESVELNSDLIVTVGKHYSCAEIQEVINLIRPEDQKEYSYFYYDYSPAVFSAIHARLIKAAEQGENQDNIVAEARTLIDYTLPSQTYYYDSLFSPQLAELLSDYPALATPLVVKQLTDAAHFLRLESIRTRDKREFDPALVKSEAMKKSIIALSRYLPIREAAHAFAVITSYRESGVSIFADGKAVLMFNSLIQILKNTKQKPYIDEEETLVLTKDDHKALAEFLIEVSRSSTEPLQHYPEDAANISQTLKQIEQEVPELTAETSAILSQIPQSTF